MFCENCGKQTPDGQRLCPECAAQLATPAGQPAQPQQPVYQPQRPVYQPQQPVYQPQQPVYQPQQQAYQPQQPVYQPQQQAYQPQQQAYQPQQPVQENVPAFEVSRPARGKKRAKKGGKVGLIVAAVVLVAIIAVVALFWGNISRFVTRQFGDPTDYMVMVEKDNAANTVSKLTDGYGQVLSLMERSDSVAAEADVSLELGDGVITLVETLLAQEGMEMDMDWLEEVNLAVDGDVKDGKYAVDVGIGVNGTNLATAKLIVDTQSMNMYMAIPELNSTYLVASMEDMDVDPEEFKAIMGQADAMSQAVLEALPPADELEKLINTYLDLILGQLKDAEKETKTVEVDGVEQELMVLTVKLSQRDILKIVEAVLEYAKDDEQLLDLLDGISKLANDMPDAYEAVDLRTEFISAVEYTLEDMAYAKDEAGTDTYLTLETYVDNEDTIVGRTVTVEEAGEAFELYYITATQGNEFAFEANLMDLVVEGGGTVKNDKYTGSFQVVYYGEDMMTLEIEDLGEDKEGGICGAVRVIPGEALLEEMGMDSSATALLGGNLGLELQVEGETVRIAMLSGNNTMLALAAAIKETGDPAVSLPGDAVSIMDDAAGMQWVADIRFDEIIGNLKNAGVPSELTEMVEMVAQMFAAEFQ